MKCCRIVFEALKNCFWRVASEGKVDISLNFDRGIWLQKEQSAILMSNKGWKFLCVLIHIMKPVYEVQSLGFSENRPYKRGDLLSCITTVEHKKKVTWKDRCSLVRGLIVL